MSSNVNKQEVATDDHYSKSYNNMSLIISYCDEDMSWMESFFSNDIVTHDVTMCSKYNHTFNGYVSKPTNNNNLRVLR